MKRKRIHLKKDVKTYIKSLISATLFVVSIFIIIDSININFKNNNSIIYKKNNNIDYKVYLKENDYFEEDYLEKDGQYISSIINNIKVNMKYSFQASNKFNYTYKYKIVGQLVVNHNQDDKLESQIFSKDYIFNDEKVISHNDSNEFDINEVFDINYQEFDQYIKVFKSNYALSVSALLKVKMYIEIEGYSDNVTNGYHDSDILELDIPIAEPTIELSTANTEVDNQGIINGLKQGVIKNRVTFTFGIIFLVISLLVLISEIYDIYFHSYHQNSFIRTVNKILKMYDNVIVNSKTPLNLDNMKIINVSSFEELLDAEEELRIPIIYNEIEYNKKVTFTIINNDQAWVYTYENNLE